MIAKSTQWLWLGLAIAMLAAGCHTAAYQPRPLVGATFTHDPSTIVRDGDRYYSFGTGRGIRTKSSPDLIHWESGAPVFRQVPDWTWKVTPTFDGGCWAPDLIHLNNQFYLYYSVSGWGKQTSAIGLATNPTLDAAATNYLWTDAGTVIASTNGSPFNTIDPSVMQDADGKLWLAFGSFWQGIYLAELNPQTGKRISKDSPLYHLAWNDAIEASCLTRHEDYYYLFVNWGQCCKGTNSTYEVRVGRAKQVTGPYLDRDGKSLAIGGGTPFLKTSGRFIGPGHIGILRVNSTDWFSYHYYEGTSQGRSRLALGKLRWRHGWPRPVN